MNEQKLLKRPKRKTDNVAPSTPRGHRRAAARAEGRLNEFRNKSKFKK